VFAGKARSGNVNVLVRDEHRRHPAGALRTGTHGCFLDLKCCGTFQLDLRHGPKEFVGATGANYASDYREFQGIKVPTKRKSVCIRSEFEKDSLADAGRYRHT
jgi:hypothetical protein